MFELRSFWYWVTNPTDILAAFFNSARIGSFFYSILYCHHLMSGTHDLQSSWIGLLDFFCASSLCGPSPRPQVSFVQYCNDTLFLTLNETEIGEVVKCMVYWLKAAMGSNLQLLQYSELYNRILRWQLKPLLTIEFGVDNRWKLAREGRMVQSRRAEVPGDTLVIIANQSLPIGKMQSN